MRQVARVGRRRVVSLAGDEVVRHCEGLAGAEIAGVVEGNRLEGGYGLALVRLVNTTEPNLDQAYGEEE